MPTPEQELFEKAIEQSNFRAIFENQKEKLIEVLKGDLIYPYGGGYFILGSLLFSEIQMYITEGKETTVLLDINYSPIIVENLREFLD